MIPEPLYLRVKELLQNSVLSHRQIELETGVSRGTVGSIFRESEPRVYGKPLNKSNTIPFSREYQRCSHCGALVRMPCLACLIEEQGKARAKARRAKLLRYDKQSRSEELESNHG